jgi:hypothetical protein
MVQANTQRIQQTLAAARIPTDQSNYLCPGTSYIVALRNSYPALAGSDPAERPYKLLKGRMARAVVFAEAHLPQEYTNPCEQRRIGTNAFRGKYSIVQAISRESERER